MNDGTYMHETTLGDDPEVDMVVEIGWCSWDAEPRGDLYPGCPAGIQAEEWRVIWCDAPVDGPQIYCGACHAMLAREHAAELFREWAGPLNGYASNINQVIADEIKGDER